MNQNNSLKKFGDFLSQLAEKSECVYWLSSPDFQTIQYISPAYEKIWNRPLKKLYADPETWITFLHPDDAKDHNPIHVMKERIEKLGPEARYNENYRIIRPCGETRHIIDRGFPIYDDYGKCLGVTGVALDITKEKQAELALIQTKEKAEAMNTAALQVAHDIRSPLAAIMMLTEACVDIPEAQR